MRQTVQPLGVAICYYFTTVGQLKFSLWVIQSCGFTPLFKHYTMKAYKGAKVKYVDKNLNVLYFCSGIILYIVE
jgi:hypothetical protein